jgi:hypothetical protein
MGSVEAVFDQRLRVLDAIENLEKSTSQLVTISAHPAEFSRRGVSGN